MLTLGPTRDGRSFFCDAAGDYWRIYDFVQGALLQEPALERAVAADPHGRVALAKPEIAGSLNLRGRIVTAIDVRHRLQLPPATEGVARMSVVTEQNGELYALLVDQVSEVLTLHDMDFEQNPPTLPPVWAEHSKGVYRLDGKLLVVLDVSRLLALGEIG